MRFPIQEYLVPRPETAVPNGWNSVDEQLLNGLPHRISLQRGIDAVMVVAQGLALTWQGQDPQLVVDEAANQRRSLSPEDLEAPAAQLSRVPGLLLIRSGRAVRGVVPLVSGFIQQTGLRADSVDALLELQILDWKIHSGNLRGGGDYGGRIRFAWRRTEKAVAHYSTPPINPYVHIRLQPIFRMVSTLGLKKAVVMPRFKVNGGILKKGWLS